MPDETPAQSQQESRDTVVSDAAVSGGQGGGAEASAPMTRSETRLVGRAIKKRWQISEAKRQEIVDKLCDIVTGPKANNRNRIGAARVLATMEGQNQADDLATDKNERLDAGKLTENIAVGKLYGKDVDTEAV